MLLKKSGANSFMNEQREDVAGTTPRLFEHSLATPLFSQADAGLDGRIYSLFLQNNLA